MVTEAYVAAANTISKKSDPGVQRDAQNLVARPMESTTFYLKFFLKFNLLLVNLKLIEIHTAQPMVSYPHNASSL